MIETTKYNQTWKGVILRHILAKRKYCTGADIVCHEIEKLDNVIEKDERKLSANLSAGLLELCKLGYLRRTKVLGFSRFFYGLPQWFEEDGKLKEEYADDDIKPILSLLNEKLVA